MALPAEQMPPESGLAVTRWVAHLRNGNSAAATRLWKYLQPGLLRLGRRQMQSVRTSCYDEDDLAQSAFHALCHALQNGHYKDLADRDEVWKLLTTITLNKFRRRTKHDGAAKRGGGMRQADIKQAFHSESVEPSAEQKLEMQEECGRLLGLLGRDEIRHVALLKVEGYTNDEIAGTLNCTRRTVQRRLDFIRTVWSRELDERE